MIRTLAFAVAIAAVNTAVGTWLQRLGKSADRFWGGQILGLVFRFCAIFGGASWIWASRRRMPEVVLFILVAAIGQLAGQSYFLLKKGAPYA